ncbi:MAG: hypothetical protein HUU04_08105 [Verrucomicrobiae bacterium]|nr:hypothetical protein [Verrucomicrobiae bacterium]
MSLPPTSSSSRSARLAGLAAAGAALLLFAAHNLRYSLSHGALASQGPDLWFYLLVARGWETLNFFDVTRLLVAPAAWLSTAHAMTYLIALAALANAAGAFLVAARLEAFLPAASNPTPGFAIRFAAGFLFALLPHNLALSVASFTHCTIGQIFLLGALQGFLPWLDGRRPRPGKLAFACLLEAAIIGPEGIATTAFFGLVALRRWGSSVLRGISATKEASRQTERWPRHLLAAALVVLIGVAYEPAFRLWARAVFSWRGIDLVWQRTLLSGDLLPLGASFFTIFHGVNLLWIALAAWHLWKGGAKSLAWMAFGLATLSLRVFRPVFLLQLIGYVLLLQLLAKGPRPKYAWTAALALLLALTAAPLTPPVFPAHLATAAKEIAGRLPKESWIACSPTYGFFLEAWTERRATATLHRPDPLWAQLAASPPAECARRMRTEGVGVLWITSHDFRLTPEGYWSSSGLQETLQPLDDAAFRDRVVVRLALGESLTPLRDVKEGGDARLRVWWVGAE